MSPEISRWGKRHEKTVLIRQRDELLHGLGAQPATALISWDDDPGQMKIAPAPGIRREIRVDDHAAIGQAGLKILEPSFNRGGQATLCRPARRRARIALLVDGDPSGHHRPLLRLLLLLLRRRRRSNLERCWCRRGGRSGRFGHAADLEWSAERLESSSELTGHRRNSFQRVTR